MIDLVIDQRRKDLGGFEVGRVLPFASQRMVGPFVFFDHMGPVDPNGAGISIKFSRCDGLNWNSGLSLGGAVPARVAQLKDKIHDAFKGFANMCPAKAGEEAALLAGFDAAAALVETWIPDRPFTYPPEPPQPK